MNERAIACSSMEIALDPAMPTCAGGLGVLAGDTIRSAAELKVPMVGVSLLHRKGCLSQRLDASGWQHEEPTEWRVEKILQELPERVTATIQRRTVHLRAWKYDVKGLGDFIVPVFLLDTGLPEYLGFIDIMRHCISLNGSFFNTQRMVQQYVVKASLA